MALMTEFWKNKNKNTISPVYTTSHDQSLQTLDNYRINYRQLDFVQYI